MEVLDEVRAIADEEGATPVQAVLRWLMDWEEFTCVLIVGARTTDQLSENVGVTDVAFSGDQRRRIEDARTA